MKQLSICIVSQQYKSVISGVGLHTRNLVSGLRKDGHRVLLLTQRNQSLDLGTDQVEIATVSAALFQQSQARWISLAWSFACKLRSLLVKEHFDLIHFTDARESFWFKGHPAALGNVNDYYAAELRPFRYYKRHYADAWGRYVYYHCLHRCERIAFHRLRALMANSRYTLEAIRGGYRLPEDKLFQCYKSIDLESFKRPRTPPETCKMVLFAGGNMQRKGLKTLICAAPAIIERANNVIFNIVGADKNIAEMKKLTRAMGVADRFFFKGWLPNEELLRLFGQAHLFVMPSLVEAFGMVLLEAMASGIPVVATDVGGIPELIGSQENGFLVPPDSPNELAAAMVEILNDSILSSQLSRNGRKRAEQFGIQAMLACTYGVYGRLLGGRG